MPTNAEEEEEFAWCNVCVPPSRQPLRDILLHLRVEHDLDMQPACWPDGEVVVIDQTLEPDDFRP